MRFQVNILQGKRGQIGETLTWIVAFLLIFFIMILFTLACTVIANVNGSPKDYVAEPVSGDISLISRFISVLNKNTMVDGKNVNLVDYIKKYPYSDVVKNDIRCMFIETGSSQLKTEGFYPSLYIKDEKISLPQGEDCDIATEDVGYSAVYVSLPRAAPLIVELKFFNCNPSQAHSSISTDAKELQAAILEMEKSGAIYDSNCERIDVKKTILNGIEKSSSKEVAVAGAASSNPITPDSKITMEVGEEVKLNEIINDKVDISIANSYLYKYDSQKKMWVAEVGKSKLYNGEAEMRTLLTGDRNSKAYPDILNAKKENGAWVIPLKNA